jgi:hypothetical protein
LSWELRAAISIARMWRNQGRSKEARGLLAPVYAPMAAFIIRYSGTSTVGLAAGAEEVRRLDICADYVRAACDQTSTIR